eukprot:364937-Chlamydomonas_euryale.AAC.21
MLNLVVCTNRVAVALQVSEQRCLTHHVGPHITACALRALLSHPTPPDPALYCPTHHPPHPSSDGLSADKGGGHDAEREVYDEGVDEARRVLYEAEADLRALQKEAHDIEAFGAGRLDFGPESTFAALAGR